MPPQPFRRFHGQLDREFGRSAVARASDGLFQYRLQFTLHQQSHASKLLERFVQGSIEGLQRADTETSGKTPFARRPIFTDQQYDPGDIVAEPYPYEEIDFNRNGAYSIYNWELFFHVPLMVAIHLSKNQRFAEAQQWFHYVFDPTDDSNGPTPARFWGVRPFKKEDVAMVEDILVNLATGDDPQLRDETIVAIKGWMENPFRPHRVAYFRPSAYMLETVMAYLDNLIDWGDSLFRQDTRETINEATQLYMLASSLLGPRPQVIPSKGEVSPQTYAKLRDDLDVFGNALDDLETAVPHDLLPPPKLQRSLVMNTHRRRLDVLESVALYFCVPPNDKLIGYWDTVADRLFKIHHSLNIHGIFRQLPLFEPPIDPGLLARAAAAGVDVGAVVSGINQPLPLVRFWVLVRQAVEICQEVRQLGANLLAAMEREDDEALASLRAGQELAILRLVESVRYAQWQEAIKNREGVERSLAAAVERYRYYRRLLGAKGGDLAIPEFEALDVEGLLSFNFRREEPQVPTLNIDVALAEDEDLEDDARGLGLSVREGEELEKLASARDAESLADRSAMIGNELAIIPTFGTKAQPGGLGADSSWGGANLASAAQFIASSGRMVAAQYTYEAAKAARLASYERREQEWSLQANLAAHDISNLFKAESAALIREAIAKRDWDNHKQQIEHSERILEWLTDEKNGQKTNQGFYAWMKREVRGLYAQCFQLALDAAKKAERALGHELGDPQTSFISTGYMSGNEGLFAGEKLYLDIKRMELAYHELNRREYEITKHISLRQVDPDALISLRATGKCTFHLPEALFDLDGPGHYFRRIRSVSVTIPAVTGPYTNVNCTLTLLKSSIRKSPLLRDGEYARAEDEDDERFSDNWSSLQSVVTSGAERDPGLFEMNLRDERYLPFEGSGVISTWQLELPSDVRKFDYDTITDVILHMLHTAREGGGLLRSGAVKHLQALIDEGQTVGSVQLLSVRHEFPLAWQQFKAAELEGTDALAELQLELRREHYPFWSRKREMELQRLDLYASPGEGAIEVIYTEDGESNTATLTQDSDLDGLRVGALTPGEDGAAPMPPAIGEFTLQLSDNRMDDLWLAVTWGWRAEGL